MGYASKYGIWGVDPYGPSAINGAVGIAKDLNSMGEQTVRTQRDQLARDYTQQTQPNQIALENLKNQTAFQNLPEQEKIKMAVMRYAPQQEQGKLGLNAAQIRELNARAGYQNAQASAEGQKSPTEMIRQLHQVLLTHSPDSPEYQYADAALGQIMSGINAGLMNPSQGQATAPPQQQGQSDSVEQGGNDSPAQSNQSQGGGVPPAFSTQPGAANPALGVLSSLLPGGGHSAFPNNMSPIPGQSINPLSVSQRSMKGGEIVQNNPNGTYTYRSSPTTAAKTQQQVRQMSEAELKVLMPQLVNGLKPYQGQGFGPAIDLISDNIAANFGDKDAMKRLENLSFAKTIEPEVANVVGKMSSGGQAGIEMQREIREAVAQGLPPAFLIKHLIPKKALNNAIDRYQPLQSLGVETAGNTANTGFALNSSDSPYFGQTSGAPAFKWSQRNSPEAKAAIQAYIQSQQPQQPQPQAQGHAQSQGQQQIQLPYSDAEIAAKAQQAGIPFEVAKQKLIDHRRQSNG